MFGKLLTTGVALFLVTGLGWADGTPTDPPAAKAELSGITVLGERERKQAEKQIRSFISAIVVPHYQESLARWLTPICPAVAGLPRDDGEYVLSRLSLIAKNAGAPLDKREKCTPNLFVIVTSRPDELLAAWSKKNPQMFGEAGPMRIRTFTRATGPVRVWYNAAYVAEDGMSLSNSSASFTAAASAQGGSPLNGIPTNGHALGFRLRYDELRNIESAIVVVDAPHAKGINFGQLAAYISLASLAEIRLDKTGDTAPTILHLFSEAEKAPPLGLSPWDEAFLKGLYNTEQSDKMQLSEVKTSVIRDVVR